MNNKTDALTPTHTLLSALVITLSLGLLAACNPPSSDQQLQEQAAKATEQAKQQSAEALQQARVAAANAERAVNDVAAGVKQGMENKTSGAGPLDLNSAPKPDLASLPGISAGKAAQIIRHRPFAAPHDLVKEGILTESQYEDIAPKVTVR